LEQILPILLAFRPFKEEEEKEQDKETGNSYPDLEALDSCARSGPSLFAAFMGSLDRVS